MEITPTILAVDDNPRNLQLISSLLSGKGYKVVVANSGENALKYLGIKQPDLLLLDIMMPGLSGYEVLETIKKNPDIVDLPVIFLTAKSELSDIVKGFAMGAVDYITKPFKSEELLARVETHIELKRMRNQLSENNNALLKLNQELTESKEIIKKDAEKLAKLNAEKDRFFSIISHDLRNPFNGCLMATELLFTRFNELSPEEISAFIAALHDAATNMNKLLENLLNWAQLQMGTLKTKLQPVDLSIAISNAVELQKSVVMKKDITITQKIGSPAKAKADQGMVDMVLRNLISNAIKFTPAGGKVVIQVEETAHEIAVSVKDSGIGMNKALQNKLFRINEKVSRPGTEGEQSTGLGLVLSFDMTQRMNGSLGVESEEGKGSTFTLTLPKA
ncbi:MAG: hypothetical protein FD155_2848 [Bacteroidetes bacterium]|nr:MAG: hypothetical protein FD155_2848 [Bacteroidota bacterium]